VLKIPWPVADCGNLGIILRPVRMTLDGGSLSMYLFLNREISPYLDLNIFLVPMMG